jgi:hypothetical protein
MEGMGDFLHGLFGDKKKPEQQEPAQQGQGGENKLQAIGHAADALLKRITGGGDGEKLTPEQEKERQQHLAEDENAVKAAGGIPKATEDRILKALDKATPDELTLIDDLFHVAGGQAHAADFFSGANTVIPDGGKLYEKWARLSSAKERISSHKAKGKQYNIPGPATGPILFAQSEDGSATWLQLEGYRGDLSLESAPDILPHMVDYVKYKLSGRNQSRFGSSEHTDKNPVVLGR